MTPLYFDGSVGASALRPGSGAAVNVDTSTSGDAGSRQPTNQWEFGIDGLTEEQLPILIYTKDMMTLTEEQRLRRLARQLYRSWLADHGCVLEHCYCTETIAEANALGIS